MAKAKLIKVKANYDFVQEKLALWGVNFVQEGELMVAELEKEAAAEMLLNGRVSIIEEAG